MRRGVPSAQTVWGNSVAILSRRPALRPRQHHRLRPRRAGHPAAGRDVRAPLPRPAARDHRPAEGDDPIEHYLEVLADKTGSLISTAARAGVMFSGAPREYLAPVVEFGEKIGIAFQLIDDVIDLSDQRRGDRQGAPAPTCAPASSRCRCCTCARRRRPTWRPPRCSGASTRVDAPAADDGADRVDEAEFADIAELREHEVTGRTRAEAHRWAREALAALDALPTAPSRRPSPASPTPWSSAPPDRHRASAASTVSEPDQTLRRAAPDAHSTRRTHDHLATGHRRRRPRRHLRRRHPAQGREGLRRLDRPVRAAARPLRPRPLRRRARPPAHQGHHHRPARRARPRRHPHLRQRPLRRRHHARRPEAALQRRHLLDRRHHATPTSTSPASSSRAATAPPTS